MILQITGLKAQNSEPLEFLGLYRLVSCIVFEIRFFGKKVVSFYHDFLMIIN